MQIARTIADMKSLRRLFQGSVGFVPTMGFLHEGHVSLIRRARSENDHVIVSIFVNPTQFSQDEDLALYPRDTKRDLALLRQAEVDVLFMPEAPEIYPAGGSTWVHVEGLSHILEGKSRPGHFRGVATVVTKLFNIVEPAHAYFGQKDAQQARIIQKMVDDLFMNLKVIVCATEREPDGLALSSRNVYLKKEERKAAAVLYRSLRLAQSLWERGERNAGKIRSEVIAFIECEPLAHIDYVSIANADTLEEITGSIECEALLSMAVQVGRPRLLDNIILDPAPKP